MDRPGPERLARQRFAAGFLGLRIEVALFQAEGVHAEHIGVERIAVVPLGQHPGHAGAQVARVAAVEVEQVRGDQRQQVARMALQDAVPGGAGLVPTAFERQLCRAKVIALARAGIAHQRRGGFERRARLGHQRWLGHGQDQVGLDHVRQAPAGVGLDHGVEGGERVAIKPHQVLQRALVQRGRCSGVVPSGTPRRSFIATPDWAEKRDEDHAPGVAGRQRGSPRAQRCYSSRIGP